MNTLHNSLNLPAGLPGSASSLHQAPSPEYPPGFPALVELGMDLFPALPQMCMPDEIQPGSFAYGQHMAPGGPDGLPLPSSSHVFPHHPLPPAVLAADSAYASMGFAMGAMDQQGGHQPEHQPGHGMNRQMNHQMNHQTEHQITHQKQHQITHQTDLQMNQRDLQMNHQTGSGTPLRLGPGLPAPGPSGVFSVDGPADGLAIGLLSNTPAQATARKVPPDAAGHSSHHFAQRKLQYEPLGALQPSPHFSRGAAGLGPRAPGASSRRFILFASQYQNPADDLPVQQAVQAASASSARPLLAMDTAARFHGFHHVQRAEPLLQEMPEVSRAAASCRHPVLAPAALPEADSQPRKKHRPESQHETERHLLGLASSIGAFNLGDSALKVKRMDCDLAALKDDPVFGLLCNAKDVKQDRHHQVFALAWLNASCEASPAAVVPRNRIYARYVQMCGEYTVRPLMPAAFGRLVRVSFPNLTSRRLGMRGKSKYHYCGLAGGLALVVVLLRRNGLPAVGLPHPVPGGEPDRAEPDVRHARQLGQCARALSHQRLQVYPGLYGMIEQAFLDEHGENSVPIPRIHSYFPKDSEHDVDIADTLHALVKIQCASMFDLVRYMRKDDLFRSMVPLPAMLMGPIFKLLNTDHAIEWVKDCDLSLYRAMLKMMSRLHLKPANKDIVGILKDIGVNFVTKLSQALGDRVSQGLKTMKLRLAQQFIKLVSRLLRCIETGSRASMVLSSPSERNAMLQDWSKLDFQETVLREIPCGLKSSQAIIRILDTLVGQLLSETHTEGLVLEKYASFLFDLPALFPSVNPWLFSLLLSNLLTNFIREMSMSGSSSFKSWWIVGCWINEYIPWSFELGGYLYEECRLQHDISRETVGLDIGLNANESGNTEFNSHEKLISTVDLLDRPHEQP
ncbi:hypothetical protein METBIDRAFT_83561 [Metschnikowia bicuspidata var. bicuspidata NRRL YB-4993]|uniref:RFX-type winged-helix domain-containing protein n=1 Tax=Metschnikowia bicuspidata var. bicuspidata NRRL YB-4993 TaxID=869754 RepID=A0A1A0H8Q9_9ASCO|nr:hypothetical protein METBIDRAFT_83561 [Metschnikowia bicuspidata var. bicuspidata NRRL YB-4993]OBA20504.1 hypothetical protein METBIDRAFT_83561 [Metschnikowia bicuspidata var. bicuspidata NRRL YB-4993]